MGSMNEIKATIRLRELMDTPQGWGRDQGREVFQRLITMVESYPGKLVIEVSLQGVERADISFASETVVEIAKRFRGNKGFSLVDVVDEDMLENWDAAAVKKGQPLMVWNGGAARVIGVQPSQGNASALAHVLAKGSTTAAELVDALNLQLTNASTKLKQLWEQGFLLRKQETAESGGVEFRYFAIG